MSSCDSIVFDRVADRYDETRGGAVRGAAHAAAVGTRLAPGSRVLEMGVGTGLVAEHLVAAGQHVVGLDLSRAMLGRAADRLDRLIEADAARLPFATGAFEAVVAVWALHVVGDQPALADELQRVLEPGGRLVAISPRAEIASTDLTDLAYGWARRRDAADRTVEVLDLLIERGWTQVAHERLPWEVSEETPLGRAASIEARDWSTLWEMDDDTWHRMIQPAIEGLRALPEPDRPRPMRMRYPLWVMEAPDA